MSSDRMAQEPRFRPLKVVAKTRFTQFSIGEKSSTFKRATWKTAMCYALRPPSGSTYPSGIDSCGTRLARSFDGQSPHGQARPEYSATPRMRHDKDSKLGCYESLEKGLACSRLGIAAPGHVGSEMVEHFEDRAMPGYLTYNRSVRVISVGSLNVSQRITQNRRFPSGNLIAGGN